jgi:hypothetical protein
MRRAEILRRARVQHDGPFFRQRPHPFHRQRLELRQRLERRGSEPVQRHVAAEILRPGRQVVRQQADELLGARGLQGIIGAPLPPDGRGALRAHLPPAERTRAVRREDLRLLRQAQHLLVQAAVQLGGKLLRRLRGGEIGAANVAHEQRVAGKHGARALRLREVRQHHAHALLRMSGRLQEVQAGVSETNRIAVFHRLVREFRPRALAQVDARAGTLSQFEVAGNEIRVQVRFDDVPDREARLRRRIDVNFNVSLRVDHRGFPFRGDEVRRVGQTP